jgi:uncharacterized membrane protein YsdA (DUF1294 family)/cold shock CspA family protein
MKKQGTVVRWDSERAFGFIRSPDTPSDIYFHRRDFFGHGKLGEGLQVVFEEIHVGGKGPRAMSVEVLPNVTEPLKVASVKDPLDLLPPAQVAPRSTPPHVKKREDRLMWTGLGLMGFWLLLWIAGIAMGRFPWVILTGVVFLNLVTFYVYWRDKEAAVQGGWRASELQLHGLALAGGWPGAWFAQQILRHKSSKASFRAAYWATVAGNFLALLGWMFWPQLSR